MKFLKRSLSTFIEGHGLRIGIGTDNGPKVLDDVVFNNNNNNNNNGEFFWFYLIEYLLFIVCLICFFFICFFIVILGVLYFVSGLSLFSIMKMISDRHQVSNL